MTRHQKRLAVPDSWPVERKEQVFTVKADAGPHGESGVPLLIVLRDVLGYVDSRKEARYALDQDSVLVNGDPVNDEGRPIGMFDILAFAEREEFYRVFPDEGGRLALTPIEADDAESKLGKVVGKSQVSGGRYQLTLHDGQTLVVDEDEYGTNDSVVVSNDDGEIVAHFPYEAGELVTAVQGQHAGEVGRLEEIQVTPGSGSNNVQVAQDDGDGFETVEEYVVVIDENFTGDDAVEADDLAEDRADLDGDETDDGADDETDEPADETEEADDETDEPADETDETDEAVDETDEPADETDETDEAVDETVEPADETGEAAETDETSDGADDEVEQAGDAADGDDGDEEVSGE